MCEALGLIPSMKYTGKEGRKKESGYRGRREEREGEKRDGRGGMREREQPKRGGER